MLYIRSVTWRGFGINITENNTPIYNIPLRYSHPRDLISSKNIIVRVDMRIV